MLEKLGAGAMGVVCAAYDPQLDRKVAIKLLRPTSGGDASASEGRSRLLREARAMARLSHPNVVTVYEVGTLGEQVFIAMELVDGEPLTHWLQKDKRHWREVLDMFLQAGRGLAAAHQAGLVHRDFKPDNVLVTSDGLAKVSDFGLVGGSTATGDVDSLASTDVRLTETGIVMGTPLYMSPEQHAGAALDARADQFSFCAALFEGLYGEPPFAGPTYGELLANVTSGRVRDVTGGPFVPHWVRRKLRTGLSPNLHDRYGSMHALLETLGSNPVSMWLRRCALAGVFLLAALAAFGMFRGRGSEVSCATDDTRFAGVWDTAVKQRAHTTFLASGSLHAEDTFKRVQHALDGYRKRWVAARQDTCEATHVRGDQSPSLMDRRVQCLQRRLEEFGALARRFGGSMTKEGVERSVRAALELALPKTCEAGRLTAESESLPDSPALRRRIDSAQRLLDRAAADEKTGNFVAGLVKAKKVIETIKDVPYNTLKARAFHVLGQLQLQSGTPKEAEQSYYRTVEFAAAANSQPLKALGWLGVVHSVGHEQARFDDARMAARAAKIAADAVTDDVALSTQLNMVLGNVEYRAGNLEAAEQHYRIAYERRLREFGPEHTFVAAAENNLGNVLGDLGHFEDALLHVKHAGEIWKKTLGESHPLVVRSMGNLCATLMDGGDFRSAAGVCVRSLDLRIKTFGEEHPSTAMGYTNLGALRVAQGKLPEGMQLFSRARAIYERLYGREHPVVASLMMNAGIVLMTRGYFTEAKAHYENVLRIRTRDLGPEHAQLVEVLSSLAGAMDELGDYAKATQYHRRALRIAEKNFGPDDLKVGAVLNNLAAGLSQQGKSLESLRHLERFLTIAEKQLGADHPQITTALVNTAGAMGDLDRCSEALPLYARALAIIEKSGGSEQHLLPNIYLGQGVCQLAMGENQKAIELAERSLLQFQKMGADEVRSAEARILLADALWSAGREKRRAVELAKQALAAYRGAGAGRIEQARAARSWLRTHKP